VRPSERAWIGPIIIENLLFEHNRSFCSLGFQALCKRPPEYLDSPVEFDETAAMLTSHRSRLFVFCALLLISQIPVQGQDLQLNSLAGVRGGNLVLAVSSDPSNFNRMLASGLASVSIAERLSADLIHINRSTLQLEPALATKWEPDKTGKVYTIHLRRGVRFSDNTPFTADDVLFTFQVLTDPKTENKMAGQIETDGAFPTMTKIDDFTLKLVFQRPVGMGLRMLDSIPILPKNRLAKACQEGRFSSAWGPTVTPAEVVGLGPFRLKEYQRGIRVVLERNPYYWKTDRAGQKLPYLDSITFLIIPDLTSEALRFQQGELDLMSSPSLNAEGYANLRRNVKEYTLRDLGPGLTMDYLWFNLNHGANGSGKPYVDPDKMKLFENPEFRRAVSYALDRTGMIRSVLLGLGTPQYGLVSSGNREWHSSKIARTEYNPARAKELLAKIGLRDVNGDGTLELGGKPLDLTLITSRGNSVREKLAQVVRDDLLKVGIKASIQLLLPNEIASRFLGSFDYEAILFGFTPTDVTPDLQTDLWYSNGSIHFWSPNQKKPALSWETTVDSLISKLVTSMDPGVRKSSFEQAQTIWASELPAIPTVASNILAAWSHKLGNVRPSVLAPHLIWNAEEITKRGQ
jgi:peptide/nickel transport system substrate-binding protein